MIQARNWSGNPMIAKESFDSFYAKKLEALRIELVEVIKCGAIFVVRQEHACKVCQKRVKMHVDGLLFCLSCRKPFGLPKATVEAVNAILARYPKLEDCAEEWEAVRGREMPREPRMPRPKQGDEELGRQIKEAREKLGMTTHELAAKITKTKGGRLTERAIRGYEGGRSRPSKNVLDQLKGILGLEV